MTVVCSTVRVALDTVGPAAITGPLGSHVESCPACASDVELSETLTTRLRMLPRSEFRAPGEFTEAVMDSLGPVAVPDLDPRHSRVVPIAAAVATAAMATAAAGTVVILRLRRTRAA